MADAWPEPKRQSGSDIAYVQRARQRTLRLPDTSWDSESSKHLEGRSPSLPHRDDSHESEGRRQSATEDKGPSFVLLSGVRSRDSMTTQAFACSGLRLLFPSLLCSLVSLARPSAASVQSTEH